MKRLIFAGALALSLGACTPTGTVNTTQAIADANIVVSGIAADYRVFVQLYPAAIPPTQQVAVNAALTAAQSALAQLSNASTTATGLQAVEDDVNVAIGVLTQACQSLACPTSVSAGLMAANVLLPLIEIVVNEMNGKTPAPKVAAFMAPTTMTPAQARLILTAAKR